MINEHVYDTRDQLAEALASGVAAVLAGGIATRGHASIAVSGGSTPKLFFEHLSREPIDWSAVTVLLVDERFVPHASDRSNAGLVRRHLLVNEATKARFVAFPEPNVTIETAAEEVAMAVNALDHGLDVVVLGMGTDGHTASFFADADSYERTTDPNGEALALPVRTPSQGEPRITLTMPAILGAHFLAVHIEGEEKRTVFENAKAGADLPITRVLRHASEVQLFWAP